MNDMSLSNKVADFVGKTFERKAEDGKSLCFMLMLDEPEFPTEILLDDKE